MQLSCCGYVQVAWHSEREMSRFSDLTPHDTDQELQHDPTKQSQYTSLVTAPNDSILLCRVIIIMQQIRQCACGAAAVATNTC